MSAITLHADYQDSSIKFVETTHATFKVGITEYDAYNYKGVVCLNLSDSTEMVGKLANSLFRFLDSYTLKDALGEKFSYSPTSYYTTNGHTVQGKKARIVPIEYVTLYWIDQATRANNPKAQALIAFITCEKIKTDASIALGIITPMVLPTHTKSELYREIADYEEKLNNAPGIAAKLQAMPVSGYAMIEGKVDMYKIQDLLAMLEVVVDPKMYATISRALNSALVSDGSIFRAMVDGHMVYPLSALATLRTLVS